MNGPRKLLDLIHAPEILVIPGVADPFTARQVAQAGFGAVFATGESIANVQFLLPDIGLITLTEMANEVRRICDAVAIPVIADADGGYGNGLNVVRTVRELERAGVAGIMLEDQVQPKRCGNLAGTRVIPEPEMVEKIKAFQMARRNPNLALIARADATATGGLEEAILRGQAYAAAGADVVFVEGARTEAQLAAIPRAIPVPTMAHMVEGGSTPLLSVAELQHMGYKAVCFAKMAMRVAAFAVRQSLEVLKRDGTTERLTDRMLTWEERQSLVGLPDWTSIEEWLDAPPK